MIEAFSLRTAHLFQDALASQARLRYRAFVQQSNLPHPHFEDMEYDEFDTPAAVYLVWRDSDLAVRGLIRLLPTNRPYMLKTYWPHLVETGAMPSDQFVWEVTRVCVDKKLPGHVRSKILPELLCGVSEFFEIHKIRAMVGVTRRHLIEYFIRTGIEWLGVEHLVEGQMERAFYVPTRFIRPVHFCKKYRLPKPLLKLPEAEGRLAA
jgi:acyl homoserine lactone synthase